MSCKETQAPDWEDVQWDRGIKPGGLRAVVVSVMRIFAPGLGTHRSVAALAIWIAQAKFVNHASFHLSRHSKSTAQVG